MELISLNILNTAMDCNEAMKVFYENTQKTIDDCKQIAKWLPATAGEQPPAPGDLVKFNSVVQFMGFHYLQLLPLLLNANTHASLRATDLLVQVVKRALHLEWLTKVIIYLTVALIILTGALLVPTISDSLHHHYQIERTKDVNNNESFLRVDLTTGDECVVGHGFAVVKHTNPNPAMWNPALDYIVPFCSGGK